MGAYRVRRLIEPFQVSPQFGQGFRGKEFGRIGGWIAEWFQQSCANQNGNLMWLETKIPTGLEGAQPEWKPRQIQKRVFFLVVHNRLVSGYFDLGRPRRFGGKRSRMDTRRSVATTGSRESGMEVSQVSQRATISRLT